MRVALTLTFPDGSQRLRCFTYQVANAPTLAFGPPATNAGIGKDLQVSGLAGSGSLTLSAAS